MELEHFHLQNSCDHTLHKATQDLFVPCELIHVLLSGSHFDQVVEFISSFRKKE